MRSYGLVFGAVLAVTSSSVATAQPLVWSGYSHSFSRPPTTEYDLPENQDRITGNVTIARKTFEGIFNITQEASFSLSTSPAGTLWAFPHNNPSTTISASNWENLEFDVWVTAFGGPGEPGPFSTIGQDAVVYLVDDDVYLDIRFTDWGVGQGDGQGAFAYVRASGADFDADGDVDEDDLTSWEANVGATAATHSQGDADLDGDVDGWDFLIWQKGYTGPSEFAAIASVPEPASLFLALLAAGAGATIRQLRPSRCR